MFRSYFGGCVLKQSPNDFKQYYPMTLANGLRVLLIHNENAKKSAAALAVNAGHFNDPKSRQGLAHFVEHLLFLGTKKYPDGSEYQQFINQFGGQNNAWTATEHTCFFFDIQTSYFEEALDRFSQFFISPLLSKEKINDERKNVDAEFKLKLKDDIRRLYDVHKETINPDHPFSQFSVGNAQTLADKNNVSIQKEALDFFNLHYHAKNMTLAIEGPQSIKLLKELAINNFSQIRSDALSYHFTDTPLYLTEHQSIKINVEPIKNERLLIISFAMENIDKYYLDKPESILAYLIGHEGQGSILSSLKEKQWAMALSAGSGINGYNFKDFNINITLTEQGEKHITQIVSTIFSYIDLLKQTPLCDIYYQEKAKMSELAFTYQEKVTPLEHVSQLVINMQYYPSEDYIFGDYIMQGHNQKHSQKLLSYLSADNLRLTHISQDNTFDKVSRWYKTPYSVERIDKKSISTWHNTKPVKGLSLPLKNLYFSEELVVYPDAETTQHTLNTPAKVVEEDGLNIWYKQDNTFKVPKGYIYLGIDCKNAVKSVTNIAMTKLFAELYTDAIIEDYYDAELAGIQYSLYAHQGGLTLQLSGLSEMQPVLLEKLLYSLQCHKVSPTRFELLKQQLINRWENTKNNKAIPKFFAKLSTLLQPNNPSAAEMSQELNKLSYQNYLAFCETLFHDVYLDVLIHGNWLKSQSNNMADIIKQAFKGKYGNQNAVSCPVVNLKNRGRLIQNIELDKDDHAGVIYYPLTEKDNRSIAITMMTSHLLSPLFFQQMRTEKQFGYLVGVGYVPINRYPGIAFYIQSPHTGAIELIKAIDLFIGDSLSELSDISDQVWEQIKSGLASQLQEKDQSLRIKSQRFWGAICNKDDEFNHKEKLIDEITSLRLTDVIGFIKDKLITDMTSANIFKDSKCPESLVLISSHIKQGETTEKSVDENEELLNANLITDEVLVNLKSSLMY